MLQQVLHVIDGAKPLIWILLKQLIDEVLELIRVTEPSLVWPKDILLLDSFVHLSSVLLKEWSQTEEELVSDDANCPPVKSLSAIDVVFLREHLWCHVLCCANELSAELFWYEHCGQAEVNQLDEAILTQYDVFKL